MDHTRTQSTKTASFLQGWENSENIPILTYKIFQNKNYIYRKKPVI